jgi:hypothetical protein
MVTFCKPQNRAATTTPTIQVTFSATKNRSGKRNSILKALIKLTNDGLEVLNCLRLSRKFV